jgi:uncharacterized phage-associated protein
VDDSVGGHQVSVGTGTVGADTNQTARKEGAMVTAHDVAAYVLRALGPMSTMKLQKLVYYSQAWHLVWEQKPLFAESIQAWANGPVVYELFDAHRGRYTVGPDWPDGDPGALAGDECTTVEAVLAAYGELSGRQLSHLTHAEAPWRDARRGLTAADRSSREITVASMAAFYEALDADDEAKPVDELEWPGWDDLTA